MADQPRYSEDGKFYWNGQAWVPVQAAAAPAPQFVQVQTRGQMPGWIAIAGLVICFPLGLIMVAFTPWKVGTKVIVAIVGIAIFAIVIGVSAANR